MLTSQQAQAVRQLETMVAGVTVLISTFALFVALFLCGSGQASRFDIGLLFCSSLISGLGITVGFHRYFTHRSFRAPHWLQYSLGIIGSMAMQGPLFFWCTYHRKHHRYADQTEDVHSPYVQLPASFWRRFTAFSHVHMGWLFNHAVENRKRYIQDLLANPIARKIDRSYLLWCLLGLALPTLLGACFHPEHAIGMLHGLIFGGLARVAIVHHITWSINSFGHCTGKQAFNTQDHSRNHWLLALLTLGEGWHNNHHAFPRSARHGHSWRQIDISYACIACLEKLKLIDRVIRPPSGEETSPKDTQT